jgi:hypothetical protein
LINHVQVKYIPRHYLTLTHDELLNVRRRRSKGHAEDSYQLFGSALKKIMGLS